MMVGRILSSLGLRVLILLLCHFLRFGVKIQGDSLSILIAEKK